ncbi:MAG: hypothetical protein ACJAV1_001395 [Paraglaciecola sp.]|jgi:hypothetical protein
MLIQVSQNKLAIQHKKTLHVRLIFKQKKMSELDVYPNVPKNT